MRSRLVRKHLGVRRTRFATPAELAELTGGLAPGAVPPFGRPILPFELFVDPGLLEHEQLAFTPGIHTVSILMASSNWMEVAQPEVFRFARAPEAESESVS
jgi:Ala-tRNA(Pro) deacylase